MHVSGCRAGVIEIKTKTNITKHNNCSTRHRQSGTWKEQARGCVAVCTAQQPLGTSEVIQKCESQEAEFHRLQGQ